MKSKVFGDLRGVIMSSIKNPTYRTVCVGNNTNKDEFNILFRGDPIFIVDVVNNAIRSCVVKTICKSYNEVTLKCSETTKNRDFKPTLNDIRGDEKSFDECIVVRLPINASKCGIASTTFNGAIKILNSFKNKNNFASLKRGDKIYSVKRNTNKIEELTIEKMEEIEQYSSFIYKITCADNTCFATSYKYCEDKVSCYNDSSFYYRPYGLICSSSKEYFVFVKKEKAVAFLNQKLKASKKRKKFPKDGTSTKLKDSKGNPICIGDTVAYVNGTRSYVKISIAKVINSSKKMIKIFDEDEKKAHIEFCEEHNKRRIEKGLKPFETDYTESGIKSLTTNKVLVINKIKI